VSEALPRLLLVDDEPSVISAITRRLRGEYEAFSANDGAQALRVLEHAGEMDIIISDMRMPGMSGAALLADTCKIYPDMVRILLTGQTDFESAIAAVNEGQIFRFLVKPCPVELLRVQLKAALRQHELVIGERVLLEQTLRGAVQALSEVLSFSMPEAVGKASRIRQRARLLAERLGIQDMWRIEVAAILSQVGAVTLSPETASKLYRAQPLTAEEQSAVNRLPTIAVELLKPIPRLEAVRELILHGSAAIGGSVPRSLEAQVLRICADYDALHDSGLGATDALASLRRRPFDPDLLTALAKLVTDENEQGRVVQVSIGELRDGMVLDEDLYGSTGTLLLARGHSIKATVIDRLRAMRSNLGTRQTVRVKLPN
jgi:response regulator RpfG family c-di-GMP phosphodiesterase